MEWKLKTETSSLKKNARLKSMEFILLPTAGYTNNLDFFEKEHRIIFAWLFFQVHIMLVAYDTRLD